MGKTLLMSLDDLRSVSLLRKEGAVVSCEKITYNHFQLQILACPARCSLSVHAFQSSKALAFLFFRVCMERLSG